MRTGGINHSNLRVINSFGTARNRRKFTAAANPPDVRVEIDRRVTPITLPITCAGKVSGKSDVSRLYRLSRTRATHAADAIIRPAPVRAAPAQLNVTLNSPALMTDSKLASHRYPLMWSIFAGRTRLHGWKFAVSFARAFRANIICN